MKDHPMNQPISFTALPPLGAELEGGIFCGLTTLQDGTHAAVILLPNRAQERMTWTQATHWVDEIGGQLPTRPVAALLFANAKDQFDEDWYWTAETFDGSYAWCQYFDDGSQTCGNRSLKGCARAVRRLIA